MSVILIRVLLIAIPFLTNMIYKLCVAFINPQLMATTLEHIASLPKGATNPAWFSEGERSVILSHLPYTSYLATIVATTFLSLLSAAVMLLAKGTTLGGLFIYLVLLILSAMIIAWVVRRKASFLAGSSDLRRKLIPTVVLCVFDILLCILSLWVQLATV